jgi:hypothetical protein
MSGCLLTRTKVKQAVKISKQQLPQSYVSPLNCSWKIDPMD